MEKKDGPVKERGYRNERDKEKEQKRQEMKILNTFYSSISTGILTRFSNIHRGPGFDSRALLRIFLRELGLERGPLSLVIG
jgi:hypothetical protein